jgi:rubredoxin
MARKKIIPFDAEALRKTHTTPDSLKASGHYSVALVCSNCGHRLQGENRVNIPRGITVHHYTAHVVCPNCGVSRSGLLMRYSGYGRTR